MPGGLAQRLYCPIFAGLVDFVARISVDFGIIE
jgi:hypothetical protein